MLPEQRGGLPDPQAQHGHLLLIAAVGGDLTALAVADDGVRAVERLDDVEALGDLALQLPAAQAAAAKIVRCARPASSMAWQVGCDAERVKRRRIASVEAVPCRSAVAYLIIWS